MVLAQRVIIASKPIITFGIRANNQSKVCSESRLSLGLDDRASEISLTSPDDVCSESRLSLGLDDRASEISLTSPDDLGLTRTSGLNGGSQ